MFVKHLPPVLSYTMRSNLPEQRNADQSSFTKFQTQTEQDQKNLEELIKTLEGALPRAKLDEAVEKEMKSIRTSLLQLVRQQEDASARADYASRMKWLGKWNSFPAILFVSLLTKPLRLSPLGWINHTRSLFGPNGRGVE